ncbi:MAG: hypothetical protein AAGA39_00590 [Pseudomonadota bacterium]
MAGQRVKRKDVADCAAQAAFDTVPRNGMAEFFGNRQADAHELMLIREHLHRERRF